MMTVQLFYMGQLTNLGHCLYNTMARYVQLVHRTTCMYDMCMYITWTGMYRLCIM